MVADLVDQHMSDDVAQRLLVLGPIVEDGAAIERDAVRPLAGRGVPALGDAAALEQAEQVERRLQREIVHDLVGRELGDLDDDLAGELAEFAGQVGVGFQRQKLEFLKRGRKLIGPVAGLIDAGHAVSFGRHIDLCSAAFDP